MENYLILPACYLGGAIPVGVIVCRVWKGVDILQEGSGNPGFANVLRVCGVGPGITVMALDILKGWLPVLFCQRLFPTAEGAWWVVLGGILAIGGHNWSVFLSFRGGKGVATSLGVLLGLAPGSALIGFAVWGGVVLLTQYSSLGSLLGALSVPFTLLAFGKPLAYLVFGCLATAFVIVRHISNIQRLWNGTERKLFTPPWASREEGPGRGGEGNGETAQGEDSLEGEVGGPSGGPGP